MQLPTTCPDDSALEQLLLGRIPGGDAVALEDHVASCSRCVAVLQQLRADDPLVEALRHTAERSEETANLANALIPSLKRLQANPLRSPTQDTRDFEQTEPSATTAPFDFLAPAQADDELGRLGSYRVLKTLGEGGMGVVFLADDPRLQRRIALKVIKPEFVKRPEARARFLREAQAVAMIEHDNIVTIFQVDEDRGVPFLAMPLLRGESLQERLDRAGGPLPLDETLRLGREIATGLAAAHDHGLVHRDIKPGNIFLSVVRRPSSVDDSKTLNPSETPPSTAPEGAADHGPVKVKILDFGLARAMRGEDLGVSQHGQILGTPSYMAPEQGRGGAVDHRADLFSLGCVLYRMTTGQPAFPGSNYVAVIMSVALDTPTPPRELNPELLPALAQLIERLLAKDPEQRPPSAHAVVEALEALERERAAPGQSKPSRRGWVIGVTAAVLTAAALAAGLAWWATRPSRPAPQKPGEVTFEFDEPGVQLTLHGDQEPEKTFTPKDSPTLTLPPGRYRLRATPTREGRELVPDEVIVKPGEAQTVVLRLVGQLRKVGGFDATVTGVAASPKKGGGTIVASTLDTNSVLAVWDGKADAVTFPVDSYQPMECVALAPDAPRAATAGGKRQDGDTGIHVWDLQQPRPKLLYRLPGHPVRVQCVAYSPDGTRLLSGDVQGNVFLWNLDKQGERTPLKGHKDGVSGVAFSADGQRALTGGRDRVAILWDLNKGQDIRRLEHPDAVRVLSVAFGPGEHEAATAGSDGIIRIWDLQSDKVRELKGHKDAVRSIAVSPDGKRLLSGGEDGTIRFWDVEKAREVYQFKLDNAKVNSVVFAADGRRAVSGGSDRAVRLWELPR